MTLMAIAFTIDGQYHQTDGGEPSRIFATVLVAVDKFLAMSKRWRVSPQEIRMSAQKNPTESEGRGRAAVYKRLIGLWGRKRGWELKGSETWNPFGNTEYERLFLRRVGDGRNT